MPTCSCDGFADVREPLTASCVRTDRLIEVQELRPCERIGRRLRRDRFARGDDVALVVDQIGTAGKRDDGVEGGAERVGVEGEFAAEHTTSARRVERNSHRDDWLRRCSRISNTGNPGTAAEGGREMRRLISELSSDRARTRRPYPECPSPRIQQDRGVEIEREDDLFEDLGAHIGCRQQAHRLGPFDAWRDPRRAP